MLSHVNPPKPGGDGVPFVRRLKALQSFEGVICALRPTFIFTHYSQKSGSQLCTSVREEDGKVLDFSGCDGCREKDEERMRGYLWVHNKTENRFEFFECTPTVWFLMQAQANGVTDFRGYLMVAQRGKSDNARLTLHLERPNVTMRRIDYGNPPSPDRSVMKLMRKK